MPNNKKGKLIVIEGSDYSGKSSLLETLDLVIDNMFPKEKKFLFTREPGNTLYLYDVLIKSKYSNECEEIRRKLKTNKYSLEEQINMFAESRYYHTQNIISAINSGFNVICDRYILSSLIYQQKDLIKLDYKPILQANMKTLELLKENDITINYIVLQLSYNDYKQRKSIREDSLGILGNYDPIEEVTEQDIIRRINLYNDLSPIRVQNQYVNTTIKSIYRQSPEATTILALNAIKNILEY